MSSTGSGSVCATAAQFTPPPPRAADPDDAASAARRAPRRRTPQQPAPTSASARGVDDVTVDDDGRRRAGGRRAAASADALVGADGANGVVARAPGSARRSRTAWRWRATSAGTRSAASAIAQTAVIELGVVPGGYGWVFPKGDHANLGVGGWAERGAAAPRPPGQAGAGARRAAASAHGREGSPPADAPTRARLRRVVACCSSATPPASSTRSPETGSTRLSSPPSSRRGRSSPTTSPGYAPALSSRARPPRRRLVGREARHGPQRRRLLLGGPLARSLLRRRRPPRWRRGASGPGPRPGAAAVAAARPARLVGPDRPLATTRSTCPALANMTPQARDGSCRSSTLYGSRQPAHPCRGRRRQRRPPQAWPAAL